MSTNGITDFASLGSDLLRAITICEERIETTKQNIELYNRLNEEIKRKDFLIEKTKNAGNHLTRMAKNVKNYIDNKRNTSIEILNTSIRSVTGVVNEPDLVGAYLQHKDGKSYVLNSEGKPVLLRAGSAAKATMGLLMSYVCITSRPDAIQLLFLDEYLHTLSSTSISNVRDTLVSFSKHIGIVGIEQQASVYDGIVSRKYSIECIDKKSKIKEETYAVDI